MPLVLLAAPIPSSGFSAAHARGVQLLASFKTSTSQKPQPLLAAITLRRGEINPISKNIYTGKNSCKPSFFSHQLH